MLVSLVVTHTIPTTPRTASLKCASFKTLSPSIVYPPRDERKDKHVDWSLTDGTLRPSSDYSPGYDLVLVNLLRERVAAWRKEVAAGGGNVTRTTLQLLQWWRREGRQRPLFFAQIEAAETVIFLKEARPDFLQGINVPRDEPSDERKAEDFAGFLRYACKMATGSGKTTVMGMLAAWSILNKVHDRGDARFSDVVLVVCPNVTIRSRLAELDPANGEASIYRSRDLVPLELMKDLTQGKMLVMNWHVLEPREVQSGGEHARVNKAGREEARTVTIRIGAKTTTARGSRYLTLDDFNRQLAAGLLNVIPGSEEKDKQGNLMKVQVKSVRYVESDTALINRLLGRDIGKKRNILVMNDEAHHAYRIRRDEPDEEEANLFGDDEEAEEFYQEATVWINGLDRIQRKCGINFCVDLSATPYFLGRVGQETNRPFPWVVSDFGLIDAIESGLTKIPQLAVRDTTGAGIIGSDDKTPSYFNIWKWILETKLTPAERGAKRANPKPEAILKYANTPIAMLGGLWEQELAAWTKEGRDRSPVFIIVCKTTPLAKMMYEWLAEGKPPTGLPPSKLEGFHNIDGKVNTIRVDSKVVHESDTDESKSDEVRWMRFTLDTVGKTDWPMDRQGRPQYPAGFEDLAAKLERPLSPPGRDVRCIVSVAMLTEGWDCNTVTHIIGLRPFMSQLLCEQVVGRGLRRRSYEVDKEGKFTEEVAKVFGVPFEIIPFKANTQGPPVDQSVRADEEHMHLLLTAGIPANRRDQISVLRGVGATRDNILRHYEQLDTNPNESLLCYYAGHGGYDDRPGRGHFFALSAGGMLRSELRDAMLRKGARLTVLLSDTCASYAKFLIAPRQYVTVTAPPVNRMFESLLLRHTGLVDINGASVGQYAWGFDSVYPDNRPGGCFSSVLYDLGVRHDLAYDGQLATWNQVFTFLEYGTTTRFLTKRREVASREQEARLLLKDKPLTDEDKKYLDYLTTIRGEIERLPDQKPQWVRSSRYVQPDFAWRYPLLTQRSLPRAAFSEERSTTSLAPRTAATPTHFAVRSRSSARPVVSLPPTVFDQLGVRHRGAFWMAPVSKR